MFSGLLAVQTKQLFFVRWLLDYSGMRRSWYLTPCLQGLLKTSSTVSAALTASERPCCNKSLSSTSAGLSQTTQSSSVACWRSVWGTPSPALSKWNLDFISRTNHVTCAFSSGGLFKPWSTSWRFELVTCRLRTSTRCPLVMSNSYCWMSSSLSRLAGAGCPPSVPNLNNPPCPIRTIVYRLS